MTITWPHFTRQFCENIATLQLLPPKASILLAVSGGIDSMLLLEAFAHSQEALGIARLGVVYLDHGLRPQDTPAEAAFVKARATNFGLPFVVRYLEIQVQGGSLQNAARQARRDALEVLAQAEGWDLIATGHHRDDQAETLLLRLLRGTSSDGLAGIAPKAGHWIHPLLPFSREELHTLALAQAIPWQEDPSNQSHRYLRNQVRHELLPNLEQTYNPQLRPQLARLASQLREDQSYFRELLEQEYRPPLVTSCEDGLILDLPTWDTLPQPLQWRCLQRMIGDVSQSALPLVHIEGLVAMAQQRDGEKRLPLPETLEAIRQYQKLVIKRLQSQGVVEPGKSGQEGQKQKKASVDGTPSPIAIPLGQTAGEVTCGDGTLRWRRLREGDPLRLDSLWEAYLPELEANHTWWLRHRAPGDILVLAHGRRTLKKWMIDNKIPKSLRYNIPLLVQRCPNKGALSAQAVARNDDFSKDDQSKDEAFTGALVSAAENQEGIAWVIGYRHLPPLTALRPDTGWWFGFQGPDTMLLKDKEDL